MAQDMTDMNAAQWRDNPPDGLTSPPSGAAPNQSHSGSQPQSSQEAAKLQHLPIKAYRSDDRLMIATPMPGLEAKDITVEVTADNRLLLHAHVRGVLKGGKELLVDEWTIGGYEREWQLPNPVNAQMANLNYGNGVLVVTLPLSDQTIPARLTLNDLGSGKGERVGNAGHPVHPSSTNEHLNAMASLNDPDDTLQA